METRLVFQGVVFTLHPTALTVEGQHSAAVNNIAIRDGEMQLHLVNFTGKLTLQLEAAPNKPVSHPLPGVTPESLMDVDNPVSLGPVTPMFQSATTSASAATASALGPLVVVPAASPAAAAVPDSQASMPDWLRRTPEAVSSAFRKADDVAAAVKAGLSGGASLNSNSKPEGAEAAVVALPTVLSDEQPNKRRRKGAAAAATAGAGDPSEPFHAEASAAPPVAELRTRRSIATSAAASSAPALSSSGDAADDVVPLSSLILPAPTAYDDGTDGVVGRTLIGCSWDSVIPSGAGSTATSTSISKRSAAATGSSATAGAALGTPSSISIAPTPRWAACSVPLDSSRMLVFGGEDDSDVKGDVWVLERDVAATDCRWTSCSASTHPRKWAGAVYLPGADPSVLVFGGERDEADEHLGHDGSSSLGLSVFDLALKLWFTPSSFGKPPSMRSGHTLALMTPATAASALPSIASRGSSSGASGSSKQVPIVLVFGGIRGRIWLNDAFVLRTDTYRWSMLSRISGKAPAPRSYHASAVVGNKLVVFGGNNGERSFNDVHVLECAAPPSSATASTSTSSRGAAGSSPASCSTSTSVSEISLAGVDPDALQWSWTQPLCVGAPPCARTGATATTIGDRWVLICGGWDPDNTAGKRVASSSGRESSGSTKVGARSTPSTSSGSGGAPAGGTPGAPTSTSSSPASAGSGRTKTHGAGAAATSTTAAAAGKKRRGAAAGFETPTATPSTAAASSSSSSASDATASSSSAATAAMYDFGDDDEDVLNAHSGGSGSPECRPFGDMFLLDTLTWEWLRVATPRASTSTLAASAHSAAASVVGGDPTSPSSPAAVASSSSSSGGGSSSARSAARSGHPPAAAAATIPGKSGGGGALSRRVGHCAAFLPPTASTHSVVGGVVVLFGGVKADGQRSGDVAVLRLPAALCGGRAIGRAHSASGASTSSGTSSSSISSSGTSKSSSSSSAVEGVCALDADDTRTWSGTGASAVAGAACGELVKFAAAGLVNPRSSGGDGFAGTDAAEAAASGGTSSSDDFACGQPEVMSTASQT